MKKTYTVAQIIAMKAKARARAAAQGETVAAAPKAPKAKRAMTPAQMNAWNTIILPKLQAGRAAKAAERAAAKAAETPVAA
jgi:hypothetical protein